VAVAGAVEEKEAAGEEVAVVAAGAVEEKEVAVAVEDEEVAVAGEVIKGRKK
jgi:hypothetical protein